LKEGNFSIYERNEKLNKKWVFNPHSGGVKISQYRKAEVERRIFKYADQHWMDKCDRIEVRFRAEQCYVVVWKIEPDGKEFRFPLCRLRHFDEERWSIALFTWSNEKYEPCIFPSGEWFGTIEECLELGQSFL
jgi:hypothetical protein